MPRSISAVMCTYNGERFLREQLDSIVNQSITVDEIIVADDGSTDDTLRIIADLVERLECDGPRIGVTVLAAEARPLGVSRNFERALRASRGEIVFLADQDDVWRPDRIRAAV